MAAVDLSDHSAVVVRYSVHICMKPDGSKFQRAQQLGRCDSRFDGKADISPVAHTADYDTGRLQGTTLFQRFGANSASPGYVY